MLLAGDAVFGGEVSRMLGGGLVQLCLDGEPFHVGKANLTKKGRDSHDDPDGGQAPPAEVGARQRYGPVATSAWDAEELVDTLSADDIVFIR